MLIIKLKDVFVFQKHTKFEYNLIISTIFYEKTNCLFLLLSIAKIPVCSAQQKQKTIADTDYFVTEWQGDEIKIDNISGENIIAQYRVKGQNKWNNCKVLNRKLEIKNLSPNKTYELRLLSVDGIKIIKYNYSISETKFNYSLKLVTQWGTAHWKDMSMAFALCKNLDVTASDTPNLTNCNDCSFMFHHCEKLKGNNKFNDWNVSNIRNMKSMFLVATSFNQPINHWDVSNVTNMCGMFSKAKSFNQPLNNWNVANVTDMNNMFSGAKAFNQPLDKWDVSKVTTMSCMFLGAKKFNQPLNKWNVSNVKDWDCVFGRSMDENNIPEKFK